MKTMTLFSRILVLMLALTLILSPMALAEGLGEGEQRVFDYAGLFTADDVAAMEEKIAQLKADHKQDFAVLTIDFAGGKTAQQYADDFYDYEGFGMGGGDNGILILIDMDNREMAISTYGDMIYYMTDERIENALDISYNYLADGDFANAAYTYLGSVEHYINEGIPGDQHTYDEETGQIVRHKDLTVAEIGISALIGAVVALLYRAGATKGYKMKGVSYSYNVMANSNIAYTNNNDQFLRSTESRSRINTGGGGGISSGGGNRSGGSFSGRSTVHRSSSGRSHGGGSRRF